MNRQLLLGAHLFGNISPSQKFEMASSLGLDSFQIFTASNLSYSLNVILKQNIIDSFHEGKAKFKNIVVFSHACYLLNIANRTHTQNYTKSYQSLCLEMERCQTLGISAVVLHPGSFPDRAKGLDSIAHTVNRLYDEHNFFVSLFLEPSAGQGNTLPVSIEDMAYLYELFSTKVRDKVKFTIDTCHLHASGVDLSTAEAVTTYFDDFHKSIGITKIGLIHLNDSLYPAGAKKDRHANIGKGTIGSQGIKAIITDPRLFKIHKILETPVTENIFFQEDIQIVKALLQEL